MTLHKEDLINIAVEKSNQAIKSAKDNIENNNLETAQNRIYYALFYIVTALAYKNDFITSKHSQLKGWFNKKFIYEDKVFEPEMIEIYNELYQFRQKSDYDLGYTPEIKTVQESLVDVTEFVEKVLDRYSHLKRKIQFDISASQLKYKAQVYAVKMTSYSLGNKDEIEQILEQYFNFIIRSRQDTDGELSKTSYGHYVLEKKNDGVK